MLNEIQMAYGFLDEETKEWVENNLKYLTESERVNFIDILKKEHPARKGIPNKEILQRVLIKVTGKAPKIYFWNVCLDCGAEYDNKLPMCPACYDNGYECRAYAVKTSTSPIPVNVIRFNKTYMGDGKEKICYGCEHRKMSYCRNFGNPDWYCKDFENCECKQCCAITKKWNKDFKQTEIKIKYGVPLKTGGENEKYL